MMTESDVYVCKLSKEDREYAAINLNEDENERPQKIKEIRQWIRETEGLCARTDDFFILRFLRACKYNIERTKCKIKNYYQQRGNTPEWYAQKDPLLPELQEMLDLGVFIPLRKLDNQGRLVVIVRAAVHDPRKHQQADMLKACLMVLDTAIKDHEPVSIRGIVAVIDMDGLSVGHAFQLTPNMIRKLVHAWQGCYPLRIQSIDFINAPVYVNVVLNIFKRFMSQKLKERTEVHTHRTKPFSDKVPASILPFEYGGTDGELKDLIAYWKKVVEDNRDWLIDDEKYKMVN